MRKRVYLLLMALTWATNSLPAQASSQLDEAIKLAVAAEYEDALLLFRRELALHPDDPLRHYLVGMTEFKLGKFRAAKGRFLVSLEKGAEFPQVYYWLARAHQELDETSGARQVLKRGLQRFPQNPDLNSLYQLLAP